MANTKINLNKQSDLSLSGASITLPVGIEITDLPGLEDALQNSLANDTAEEVRALAAEKALQADIDANQVASEAAEKTIQADVDANQVASEAADTALSNQIADIITNVDPAALDSLTEIVTAFQTADGDLTTSITDVLGQHTSELNTEIAARISGDTATLAAAEAYADSLTDSNYTDIEALQEDLGTEIIRAKAAEDANEAGYIAADAAALVASDAANAAALVASDAADAVIQADVDANQVTSDAEAKQLASDIAAEEARAMAAEKALQADVDANQVAYEAADAIIQADVDANQVAYEAADAAIQADVDANQVAYEAADTALSNQIADIISNVDPAALDSLTEIVTAFQTADGDLTTSITDVLGTHTSELNAEIAARISGDTTTLAAAEAYADSVGASGATDYLAADAVIQADVDANQVATAASFKLLTSDLDAEIVRATAEEALLDGRIVDIISNVDITEVDSFSEIVDTINVIMTDNFEYLYTTRMDGEMLSGVFTPDDYFYDNSEMVYLNGLLMEPVSDYTVQVDGTLNESITLLGDALTASNAGGKFGFYATPADSISTVDITKPLV